MTFFLRVLRNARPRSHELIGPPDPVSNIRPIILSTQSPPAGKTHPYSLAEFGESDEDGLDLQWRFERERLNAFNHAFWWDNNTRFMRGRQQVLQQFREGDGHSIKDKEVALSNFYSAWSIQEHKRQAAYTAEWNRRNHAVIKLTIRRQLHLWRNALLNAFNGYPR